MVEWNVLSEGKWESADEGEFGVSVVDASDGVKGGVRSNELLAGKLAIGAFKTTVASWITRLRARACRTKGKNMDKACRIMAGVTTDVKENGAENILSVYMDEED